MSALLGHCSVALVQFDRLLTACIWMNGQIKDLWCSIIIVTFYYYHYRFENYIMSMERSVALQLAAINTSLTRQPLLHKRETLREDLVKRVTLMRPV